MQHCDVTPRRSGTLDGQFNLKRARICVCTSAWTCGVETLGRFSLTWSVADLTEGMAAKKIRILSFQSGDILGGTELNNYRIISRMDRERFEVDVCFLDNEGPLTPLYRALGFRVYHLLAGCKLQLSSCLRLTRILRRTHYDILHIFGLRANLIGRVVGRLFGVRRIITGQRSVDAWRSGWHALADHLTSPLVSVYISNSYAGAETLRTRERISREKVIVIHNGIDWSRFALPRLPGPVRHLLGVPPEVPVIVSVGELRDAKGHSYLLEAVSKLRSVGKEFRMWLVGDGVLRETIERQIRQFGLESIVTILGSRKEIPEILRESDIYCLASLWEGLPTSIMEAMSSALPVVATAVGGVPELVRDGETGLLVPSRDPKALAEALAKLLDSPRMRVAFGEAGQSVIKRHFAIADKIRDLEKVYEDLLSVEARTT